MNRSKDLDNIAPDDPILPTQKPKVTVFKPNEPQSQENTPQKVDLKNVSIGDLKEVHKKKVEVSKQERVEEQRKIEDKDRLVQARKEELRLMKEKESRNIDDVLGGSELLHKDDEDDFKKSIKEFDSELK